jgi:hypothetical protein
MNTWKTDEDGSAERLRDESGAVLATIVPGKDGAVMVLSRWQAGSFPSAEAAKAAIEAFANAPKAAQ